MFRFPIWIAGLAFALPPFLPAQTLSGTTAGGGVPSGGGTNVSFGAPTGVSLGDGIVIVATDVGFAVYNHGIWTAAASIGGFSCVGMDPTGNLYVCLPADHMVRRFLNFESPTSFSALDYRESDSFAGNGTPGYSGDGGLARLAQLETPNALVVKGGTPAPQSLSVFIADPGNQTVRLAYRARDAQLQNVVFISTVAGMPNQAGFSGDGGSAKSAQLNNPNGLALDSNGNLFIADSGNGVIREIPAAGDPNSSIATITPPPTTQSKSYRDVVGLTVRPRPMGVAVDATNTVYYTDANNSTLMRVNNGSVTLIAGNGQTGFSGDGGPAANAVFTNPIGLAIDSSNNIYVADTGNFRVRKISNGTVSTIFGNGKGNYGGDGGVATRAQIYKPEFAVKDAAGNTYIADTGNNLIRKVDSHGIITTFAGTGTAGYSGDGGLATSAKLKGPFGVAVAPDQSIIIADTNNFVVRKVTADGKISTIVGNGNFGTPTDGAAPTAVSFGSIASVAFDKNGNLVLGDNVNAAVYAIQNGTVKRIAGGGGFGFAGDGGPATAASLGSAAGVAFDAAGNLYIADSTSNAIRKVDAATQKISTVAGIGNNYGFAGDGGSATSALLSAPNSVAVDSNGNLFIADTGNSAIRTVNGGGTISTIAGGPGASDFADGGNASRMALNAPRGVWVDSNNNVIIADTGSHRIRTIYASAGSSATISLNISGTATMNSDGSATLSFTGTASLGSFGSGTVTGSAEMLPASATTYDATGVMTVTLASGDTFIAGFHIPGLAQTGATNFTTGTASVTRGTGQFMDAAGWFATVTGSFTAAQSDATHLAVAITGSGSGSVAAPFFTGAAQSGSQFIPVAPCRIADTRNATGPFGGPMIASNSSRDFAVPSSACNIPSTAQAYSLNVTAVPHGGLGYLTIWPTGQTQPFVSTLNSLDGRIKANAAIVPAGTNGSVSVFVTNTADVVLDINGYFVPAGNAASALSFYPVTPCRISDTRNPAGPLGGPTLSGSRTIPVSSACSVPAGAQAYSLNFTAVPHGALGYLTTWPTGQAQPFVSTLNAPTGAITANAAIVPAGTNGSIDVYALNPTDLVIDINGYFAPAATGGLSFYAVSPCRISDTRNAAGTLGGPILGASQTRNWPVPSSACGIPTTAQAYSLNATVVPTHSLGYLTLWPSGGAQPFVSTLNSLDGSIVANAAIVPAGTSGAISSFVTDLTDLILDISGYFAP